MSTLTSELQMIKQKVLQPFLGFLTLTVCQQLYNVETIISQMLAGITSLKNNTQLLCNIWKSGCTGFYQSIKKQSCVYMVLDCYNELFWGEITGSHVCYNIFLRAFTLKAISSSPPILKSLLSWVLRKILLVLGRLAR